MNRATWIVIWLLIGMGGSGLLSWSVHHYLLQPAKAREEAFEAFKSGSLLPGSDGVVVLPARWEMASADGKGYITRTSAQTAWMLFLTEPGRGTTLHGTLFCTVPAKTGARGMVEIDYPKAGSKVEVKVLRVLSPWSFEVVNEKDAPKLLRAPA